MSVRERQALLARFLDDPELEARVRSDPEAVAAELDVAVEFTRWLAALPDARVASFRRSRVHKDAVRSGNKPTLLDS